MIRTDVLYGMRRYYYWYSVRINPTSSENRKSPKFV